jgi:hypothetical protein
VPRSIVKNISNTNVQQWPQSPIVRQQQQKQKQKQQQTTNNNKQQTTNNNNNIKPSRRKNGHVQPISRQFSKNNDDKCIKNG